MKTHECVSFLIVEGDKVLLEKRSDSKKTDPGLITIPGGHIEFGESRIQALFRELKEEVNIVPNGYHYLCSLYHPTNELQLIHYYIVSSWQGDMISLEADEIDWHSVACAPVGIKADRVALSEYDRIGHQLRQLSN
ncbi:NTP pyrophosphohydrolase [Vibrio nigripulchritudo SFn27]|uniref:8-oxo-dGTP diphosphatase n=1 Tax=Vibrio nigripulchritudo TaxID=28173 RepID=A0A9P1JL89_9VIBR|nr:NUDIX domain-containing protein [Vibrio nigripulchritudo]CBJ93120.1 Putative NTP pyrophosphohydrolase (NUDIX hydrolase, MutT) [Vibrio nigripulchritudo]CCN85935.1 NTP pyrophosphohydrolase [Vibrio nigripulchritudo BLFn1]CCN91932.1 NTP pyrophosphohydrolase [Vibrio nigripulchritudo SFn27]CCN97732.1 NTP pyrophosphohydrolase [Vibrio nigripulchritudo ENn2]CCO43966.1 NTP pyrophosphohydrolase [Vibrio nigripulchritudo SFn135]